MTDTETHPLIPPAAVLMRPRGLVGLFGSGDHKALGRVLITLSILVVAASEVLGFLLRLDTVDSDTHQLLSLAKWFSLSTLQPTGIVLVGLIPLMLGIGLVMVPLQIGSRTVTFPRAAAAAVWAYFVAGTLYIVSYFTGGGAPVDTAQEGVEVITRSSAVDLWALSLILLIASIVVLSVVLVTTVFTQRAPGMTMTRLPLFSWSIVVAGIMWALTLSVAAALMVLVWVDHSHGAILSGGSNAFSQISWLFEEPQIYVIAIPALGILGDIVTTFTRVRDGYRRGIAMFYVGAFAILCFGAYTVPMYARFLDDAVPAMGYGNPVLTVGAILIVFPVLGMVAITADKFIRGRRESGPVRAAPLPGAVVSLILLVVAVLLGMFTTFESLGLHGTLYEDAVTQLIVGATIAAASAALFHWASKIAGANALNAMGMVAAVLVGLGSAAIAVADVIAAITGSDHQHQFGSTPLNTLAVIGWAAVAGTVFLTIIALVVALKRYIDSDVDTEADPWGVGQTLEWATASPPLYEDFLEIPPVTSASPLLDTLDVSEVEDLEVVQ